MGRDTVNTDPIRRFEEEHEVALAALERLEQAAHALRDGGPVVEPQFAVAREVHGLLCDAVRHHNEDEERGRTKPCSRWLGLCWAPVDLQRSWNGSIGG